MVVLRTTERQHLVHAVALLTWPSLAAPILGPALGGFITTYASWRWNFLLNVPLGIAGALLALRHIPDSRDPRQRALDWPGFVLSAAALVLLLYGLEGLAHSIGHWAWPLASAGAGMLLAMLATWHFRRTRHPLLDLAALRIQTYCLSTLDAGFVIRVAINATPFLLPLLFQLGFGLSAWSAGMLVLVYFAGNIGMKPFTTRTLRRFGFRQLLVANGLLVGASIALLAAFGAESARWPLMIVLLLAGAVRSMQFTCLNTLVFADVPDRLRAPANTLTSMATEVASAAGVAVAALLLALSQSVRGADALATVDFRWAFAVLGLVALLAAASFTRLPREAGAVVSGHRG
jgi:MFS family permease